MEKKIISIGYEIPGHSDLMVDYSSNKSILDGDLIVFAPDFSGYSLHPSNESYNGKPRYGDDDSFRLREDTIHWKSELATALQAGKTIFVFFVQFRESYVYSGRREYSGSGRNARTTSIVDDFDNYRFLPIDLGRVVPKGGDEILFTGLAALSVFWKEFRDYLKYESYIDKRLPEALFLTKTGDKTVGGLFRVGRGNLVLLPVLEYDYETFVKKSKKGDEVWTKEAVQFGKRLIKAFVDIDRALRADGERTPPPAWVADTEFVLAPEEKLKVEIEEASKQIEHLMARRNALHTKLDDAVGLKDLLFEKGERLENAIITALGILGYNAENYDDGELELDQVVVSPEGERFIGEAEGKDTSAVNIDKLRQLVSNLQEDAQREEVSEPARGILFGNGYRLTKPADRAEQFTEKCMKVAKMGNHILVPTSDLYRVAKYVQETGDEKLAKACRDAISTSHGAIVAFPTIPSS